MAYGETGLGTAEVCFVGVVFVSATPCFVSLPVYSFDARVDMCACNITKRSGWRMEFTITLDALGSCCSMPPGALCR